MFDEDCARATSQGICHHIRHYYPAIAGTPIIFHKINVPTLTGINGFGGMEIEETLSDTGDPCHRDIKNVSNNHAKQYAKAYIKPPAVYMCCNGEERELTKEQYEDLNNNLCEEVETGG